MSYYYNNEDAGDLSAYNEAEYYAEMEMEREADRRARFVEAFDRDMSRPVSVWIYLPGERFASGVEVQGPQDLPWCESCCARIRRDSHEARFHGGDGVYLCSEECSEAYDMIPGHYEGREFPTYP